MKLFLRESMGFINKGFSFVLILILAVSSSLMTAKPAFAQNADENLSIVWQNYLPGIGGFSVIQTSDGGYLALGENISTFPMVDFNETFFQTVAVKTDSSGNLTWEKVYSLGVPGEDTLLTTDIQTSDGYLLSGDIGTYGEPSSGACLLKIDSIGNVLWQKTYAPLGGINAFIQTSDGGFAMVGALYTVPPSPPEFGVMKVDSSGNVLWETGTSYNDTFFGDACSLFQTKDQGYIIVSTEAHYGPGSTPIQMFKLDSDGNLQWTQTYFGEGDYYSTYASSSIALSDGYLIVGGVTPLGGSQAGFIFKTDLQGNLVWNKTYTYSGLPRSINSISEADNDLMFVGTATNETNYGEFDSDSRTYTWITQMDSSGNVQGQLAIDMGNYFTSPTSIIQTIDGEHVFVGTWNETSVASVNEKFWIVKVSSTTQTPVSTSNPSATSPMSTVTPATHAPASSTSTLTPTPTLTSVSGASYASLLLIVIIALVVIVFLLVTIIILISKRKPINSNQQIVSKGGI